MITVLEIFAEETVKLQNVYAPLPLGIHIGFCIIATIVYALLYMRRRSYNYLCLLAAVDLTIVTQFFPEDGVITALFIVEIGLLAACVIYSVRESKAKKAAAAEAEAEKYKKLRDEAGKKDQETDDEDSDS